METKLCKHRYDKVIKKVEEWKQNYTANNCYDYTTLTQEEIHIYCIKCGDFKRIDNNDKTNENI